MRNVTTDWESCIEILSSSIAEDRSLILGTNSLQELYTLLHLSGLWTSHALAGHPRQAAAESGLRVSTVNEKGILGSASLPNILHVALVVPRTRLSVFTRERSDSIGTPGLHGSVYNGALFENSFYAIDLCFGKLSRQTGGCLSVVEDPLGWRGTSDLIVTWATPSFPFLIEGHERTRVALIVNFSLSSTTLTRELGTNLRVFDAELDDGSALRLLQSPLCVSGEFVNYPSPLFSLSLPTQPQNTPKCTASMVSGEVKLDLFTIREDYAGSQ